MNVFIAFFVVALVSVVLLSPLIARLPEDTRTSPEPLIIGNALLRPFRAATYLANLIDLQSIRPPRAPSEPPAPPPKP